MIERIIFFAVALLFANACLAYNPIIDGALVDLMIKVVDDRGETVSGAKVEVVIYTAPQKTEVKRGETDGKGLFAAKGRSYGEVEVYASKDGYYDTHTGAKFRTLSDKEVEKSRRWSEGTVETEVVLKKVRSPVSTAFHLVDYATIPATNEVVCLDLETFKWCPPYGDGKRDDLHLLYEVWRNPSVWSSFHKKLTISAPNSVDGFYRRKVETFSKYRYEYSAETNEKYEKELTYNVDRRGGKPDVVELPADDEYFVFRMRTVTNEVGKVIHANYGRIGEKSDHMFGLRMTTWFNMTDNDTNLEDARLR